MNPSDQDAPRSCGPDPRRVERAARAWRYERRDPIIAETPGLARVTHDLRWVERRVRALYRSPDLGNFADPIDELVYIILSRRTREAAYQAAFARLRSLFPVWDLALDAPIADLEAAIRQSGLASRKAICIQEALRTVHSRFGALSFSSTSDWSDEELSDFLSSMPEMGRKSAACVMLMSLGRPTFPVDAHVGRVLSRIEPFKPIGLHLSGLGHRQLQRVIPPLVEPRLRHSLHVNLLAHGRAICRPLRPRCDSCVLAERCDYGKRTATVREHA